VGSNSNYECLLVDFKTVYRFENKCDVREFKGFNNSTSKSSEHVGVEDYSTVSYSSQV